MPKLPVTPLRAGWTAAKVEGITFRPSTSSGNPMLQVEVSLESGQITDIFLVLTTDGREIASFLTALGYDRMAETITRKRTVPSFELDELLGEKLRIYIPPTGMIKLFKKINEPFLQIPTSPKPWY